MNFLGGQKFEVCFYASYLYLNESKRGVDLIDFREKRPECLLDVDFEKCYFRNPYLKSFTVIYSFPRFL